MLNDMGSIKKIEEYLSSGKLEKEFKQCGEYQKGEILEALEKLMDLGDLADQVATRLIYRGLLPVRKEN